jgi:REP element-mobilizing transposase RayT
MKLIENQIFHIYNRGNNRQIIFFREENYLFFLQKMRDHLLPTCEFLAYCLMPNHFHFLVKCDSRTIAEVAKNEKDIAVTAFSKGLRIALSSYTQAIQKQEQMTGSLFQQKTKAKQVSSDWSWEDYTLVCFRYILQNPVRAGLAHKPEDWPYSNCRDLLGLRNGTICNRSLIDKELALHINSLEDVLGHPVSDEDVAKIW